MWVTCSGVLGGILLLQGPVVGFLIAPALSKWLSEFGMSPPDICCISLQDDVQLGRQGCVGMGRMGSRAVPCCFVDPERCQLAH